MNILFLSHRLPYAPNRGDRIRAYHLLREMSRWATVDLVSLVHDEDEASHAGDLREIVRSATVARVPKAWNHVRAGLSLFTSRPTTHSLLHSRDMEAIVDRLAVERRPDLVFCYCTGVAPVALRPSLAGVPLVLDMVDVDSAKWRDLSLRTRFPLSRIYARESRVLAAFEVETMRRAAVTIVVNERERQDLLTMLPGARVEALANGVDVAALRSPESPVDTPVAVFCGVMNYPPNAEGARWVANDVWPLVRAQIPNARLELVGASPTADVLSLANASRGVTVTGSVPDVRPHLWGAAVALAPLHTARGVQNKVLEAVAAGLPVVVTPAVWAGLPEDVLAACVCADSPQEFAKQVVEHLRLPPAERTKRAGLAALDGLSWERRLAGLQPLISDASIKHVSDATW